MLDRQTRAKPRSKLKVPFSELTFHALIGKGSFKQVYRGKWNNTIVAIVAMRRGGLVTEARLMQQLGAHPNLVQFYRWSTDARGNEYVVVELVPFGGLDKVLGQFGRSLRNRSKLMMCEQICHAMCELADEGVLHRDLAARNILVQSMQPVHVKVTDFGLARVAPPPHNPLGESVTSAAAAAASADGGGGGGAGGAGGAGGSATPLHSGARSSDSSALLMPQAPSSSSSRLQLAPPSLQPQLAMQSSLVAAGETGGAWAGAGEEPALVPVRWSAPEVLRTGGGWSEKSDVYSYGVTMWEIFSDGAEPYASLSNEEAAAAIVAGEMLPRPKNCPHPVYSLMLDCWRPDPAQRPSFRQIADVYRRWREVTLAAKAAGHGAGAGSTAPNSRCTDASSPAASVEPPGAAATPLAPIPPPHAHAGASRGGGKVAAAGAAAAAASGWDGGGSAAVLRHLAVIPSGELLQVLDLDQETSPGPALVSAVGLATHGLHPACTSAPTSGAQRCSDSECSEGCAAADRAGPDRPAHGAATVGAKACNGHGHTGVVGGSGGRGCCVVRGRDSCGGRSAGGGGGDERGGGDPGDDRRRPSYEAVDGRRVEHPPPGVELCPLAGTTATVAAEAGVAAVGGGGQCLRCGVVHDAPDPAGLSYPSSDGVSRLRRLAGVAARLGTGGAGAGGARSDSIGGPLSTGPVPDCGGASSAFTTAVATAAAATSVGLCETCILSMEVETAIEPLMSITGSTAQSAVLLRTMQREGSIPSALNVASSVGTTQLPSLTAVAAAGATGGGGQPAAARGSGGAAGRRRDSGGDAAMASLRNLLFRRSYAGGGPTAAAAVGSSAAGSAAGSSGRGSGEESGTPGGGAGKTSGAEEGMAACGEPGWAEPAGQLL
ncbi:hypothetical protein GPECTOR_25g394 [Gonium pectorale]|uniref:Protein kinase domain-containing protein n=1 Tax=Gonium pectorale TaxID=33097 RepID=A0A150GHH3_GONPE|nr:hypothetical protein GPECTOR_25g394 [Gonium pectorale]|eukprot:KXZ48810.1 hypothetical protein GPECTOR_25g394 [Gonium pectorale]